MTLAESTEQREAELAAHVRAVVDKAPPLTGEQFSRLAYLLRSPKIEQYAPERGRRPATVLDPTSALSEMLHGQD